MDLTDPDSLTFKEPDDLSDITLIVEGNPIYAHKVILATASPVWKKMLMEPESHKFRDVSQIELEDKKYDDIVELLRCIYPSVRQHIHDRNVMEIIPLADEYGMIKLKEECEDLLLIKLHRHDAPASTFLSFLTIAQKYHMVRVLEKAAKHAAKLSLNELDSRPEYPNLHQDTYVKILETRIRNLEKHEHARKDNVDSWIGKTNSLTQDLEHSQRELTTALQNFLDENKTMLQLTKDIGNVWNVRGPECRCSSEVHRYGNFDFRCEECCERVRWYIRRKGEQIEQIILDANKRITSTTPIEPSNSNKNNSNSFPMLTMVPSETDKRCLSDAAAAQLRRSHFLLHRRHIPGIDEDIRKDSSSASSSFSNSSFTSSSLSSSAESSSLCNTPRSPTVMLSLQSSLPSSPYIRRNNDNRNHRRHNDDDDDSSMATTSTTRDNDDDDDNDVDGNSSSRGGDNFFSANTPVRPSVTLSDNVSLTHSSGT